MKFIATTLVLVGVLATSAFAQVDNRVAADNKSKKSCASHDNYQRMLAEDPTFRANQANIEKRTADITTNNTLVASLAATTTLRIPVVVHVIYNTAQQNISDAQIQSQIAVLNKDFRKLNADASKVPTEFAGRAADTNIEFFLATTDPNGKATTGITRKSTTKTSWGTRDAMKSSKKGGVDPWNTAKYLNLWVCEIGGGILGYAQFPGGTAATDGVVIGPNYFGSSEYGTGFFLAAPYDKGRTATHEIGHWMNLRHIWGDATCGNDFVADTPAATSANYGCPTYPSVGCSNNMMTMNYMDYTDDACMYMFTTGQKDRMRAIFDVGGARATFATTAAARGEFNTTEIATTSAIELYPNPTAGVSTLKLNLAAASTSININVVDAMGRVVYAYENKGSFSNTLVHDIDLSALNRGIYFVNVATDTFREVKKLVIQ